MRNFVQIGVGIIAAFILYAFFGKISYSLPLIFNFFSILVLYFAITKGEIYGSCMGTVSGLIQDSFSLGVFGIGGLTKTIMGYAAGYVAQKVNVVPFFRNLLFIFMLMVGETGITYILYSFIYPEYVQEINPFFLFQPLGTAVLGSLIFFFIRRFKKQKD